MKRVICGLLATEREWTDVQDAGLRRTFGLKNNNDTHEARATFDETIVVIRKLPLMGNLNATLLTTQLIRDLRPVCVVGAGICASPPGRLGKAQYGDLAVSTGVVYYEPRKVTAEEEKWRPAVYECLVPESLRERLRPPARSLLLDLTRAWSQEERKGIQDLKREPASHLGVYLSGEAVVADEKRALDLVARVERADGLVASTLGAFPVAALEMESAGIAAACQETPTKFLVAKAISDFADSRKSDDWQRWASLVSLYSLLSWAKGLTADDLDLLGRPVEEPPSDRLWRAREASRLAGGLAPTGGVAPRDISSVGRNPLDPVTRYDRLSQAFLKEFLCGKSKDDFVGEEEEKGEHPRKRQSSSNANPSGGAGSSTSYWCVDPIDGTQNLVAGRPEIAVSVAFIEDGVPVVGSIYLPGRDLTIAGEKNEVTVNGVSVRPSRPPVDRLSDAVVALPGDFGRLKKGGKQGDLAIRLVRRLSDRAGCIRITGALAYDLACLVMGEIDARLSTSAKLVDVAAGVLLVRSCGGKVTDLGGQDWTPNARTLLAARTESLHREILAAIVSP